MAKSGLETWISEFSTLQLSKYTLNICINTSCRVNLHVSKSTLSISQKQIYLVDFLAKTRSTSGCFAPFFRSGAKLGQHFNTCTCL